MPQLAQLCEESGEISPETFTCGVPRPRSINWRLSFGASGFRTDVCFAHDRNVNPGLHHMGYGCLGDD